MSPGDARQRTRRLAFRALWQALGWVGVAAVVALSLRPDPPHLPSVLGWDKAQHLVAYAGLMWWFRQAFPGRARSVIGLLALGVGLEFLQALTPHRTFDPVDMVANALGVALGLALTSTLLGRTLAWADALLQRALDARRARRGR